MEGYNMCIENFYTLFKQKWKTKTSIQKSQREAFGECLGISSLG
jgi:hypothetical protein